MLHTLSRYYKIWLLFGKMSLQLSFVNRGTLLFFFIAKMVRYLSMLIVLFVLRNNITAIAQYTVDQMIVFFLVYQTVDSFAQIFFRGVYEFGEKIRTGNLDFDLLKPVHSLFRALLGNPDVNDVLFTIPTFLLNIFIISHLDLQIGMGNIGWFLFLFLNGLLLAAAFHICVLSLTVMVVEVDNIIWLYRDLSRLGQIPVSLHLEIVRWLLIFVIPVGVMMTVPAEALLGLQTSVQWFLIPVITLGFVGVSLLAWRTALRRYTGASS